MVEKESPRVEVDTSAPFDSVKEAASRFGQLGYWRRCSFHNQPVSLVAQQPTILEKELIAKEKETLDILNQLLCTKSLIQQLKSKLLSQDPLEKENPNITLTRTLSDLTCVRSSAERLNSKLETDYSYLEEETTDTNLENRRETTEELRRLTQQIEKFALIGESAQSEALKAISEIEQTKTRMKTIEARITATRKLQEASRAMESVALSKINSLSKDCLQEISLTLEEYKNLKDRSSAAEERAAVMIKEAMKLTDRALASKSEMVKKVAEATEEVRKSKQVLEEALKRVEDANTEKMRAEEALRKWRSDRRSQIKKCDATSELKTDSTIGDILRRKQANAKVKEKSYIKRIKFEFPRFSAILLKNADKMPLPDLR